MTQQEAILQYINDNGSITTYEAFANLGITKLTTRISELRRKGYRFSSEPIPHKCRYGRSVPFYRYRRADL